MEFRSVYGMILAGLLYYLAMPALAQASPDDFYRQRIVEAWTAASSQQHARADQLLGEVIADPAFSLLPELERRQLLSRAAWAAAANAQLDIASERYSLLTKLDSDDPEDWYRMSLVEMDRDDLGAATRAMTVLVERWPELLENVDPEILYTLALHGNNATPDRIAYQQALFDANWNGGSSGQAGGVWLSLANARLAAGETEQARGPARRINEPEPMITMRADRRFDALLDRDSWRANISHATQRQIEKLRRLASAHPTQLEPLVQLSYALLLAGQHEEAIELTNKTLAHIVAAPLDEPAFTDLHNQVWLMNNKAIALRRTGRLDAAVAELRQASLLGERGGLNVSQTLNLATLECGRGQADAALSIIALAPPDNMSKYGKAVHARIRHCAALLNDDRHSARKALAELESARADAPMLYLDALIESGDGNTAVLLVRQLLDSPGDRSKLLGWTQDCRLPEAMPGQVQARARKQAFLQRTDVLAAINTVGRIESYDVFCHIND